MPVVNGKHFPYTKKGKDAAKKAKKGSKARKDRKYDTATNTFR